MNDDGWPYTRYDEDEVKIDWEEIAWDADGEPTVERYTYTDLTKKLTCQEVEGFARNEASLEGWDVESSGWTDDGKHFVLEVLAV